eukprot:CFRG1728T1
MKWVDLHTSSHTPANIPHESHLFTSESIHTSKASKKPYKTSRKGSRIRRKKTEASVDTSTQDITRKKGSIKSSKLYIVEDEETRNAKEELMWMGSLLLDLGRRGLVTIKLGEHFCGFIASQITRATTITYADTFTHVNSYPSSVYQQKSDLGASVRNKLPHNVMSTLGPHDLRTLSMAFNVYAHRPDILTDETRNEAWAVAHALMDRTLMLKDAMALSVFAQIAMALSVCPLTHTTFDDVVLKYVNQGIGTKKSAGVRFLQRKDMLRFACALRNRYRGCQVQMFSSRICESYAYTNESVQTKKKTDFHINDYVARVREARIRLLTKILDIELQATSHLASTQVTEAAISRIASRRDLNNRYTDKELEYGRTDLNVQRKRGTYVKGQVGKVGRAVGRVDIHSHVGMENDCDGTIVRTMNMVTITRLREICTECRDLCEESNTSEMMQSSAQFRGVENEELAALAQKASALAKVLKGRALEIVLDNF